MKTPISAIRERLARTVIFIMLVGLLTGTGYGLKVVSESTHALAVKSSSADVSAEKSAKAHAAPPAFASAPLPPSPGQAKFHPNVNLSNPGGQASNLSDVAYAGNKVYVAWHEMGTATEV